MPIAAAAVHDSCWWIFSCLLLFFSNIKAMVCIYHNNCSKEFNTIAPLKRIKKHIFFSNFSFILQIKLIKIECLPSYLFVEFYINLIFSMQQTICLRWDALFHICLIYVANANEFKLTHSNFTKIFFFFLALRNFPSNYIF